MANERVYTSRRANIVEALVEKLKNIDGSGAMLTDVGNNVHPFLRFWDEVEEFPALHCVCCVRRSLRFFIVARGACLCYDDARLARAL